MNSPNLVTYQAAAARAADLRVAAGARDFDGPIPARVRGRRRTAQLAAARRRHPAGA
ncbi:MAG: hypothetical protein ACJ76V_04950 [Thermoleophilaceae bacterium]